MDVSNPAPAPLRSVLLLPTQAAALRTLALAADELEASERYATSFSVTSRLADDPALAGRTAWPYALREGAPKYVHQPPSGRLDALRHWSGPATEIRIQARTAELCAWRSAACELLDASEARVVLTSDDRLSGPHAALLAEAGRRGVPRVVLSYALSRAVGSIRTRRGRRSHIVESRPLRARKRSIAKRLPGQVYAHEGQRFLFYDAEVTLSHERAEMLPDRPWALGGGLCDLAALSTPSDRDYIASHGVSRDRLHVIGDLSLDSVHAAWRQRDAIVSRLRERYFGGRRTRPLVIMAVTQFAEQGLATREAADRAAREMVAPAAAVADVLVSLHPKSRSADYTFLDREFGARIAAEPLHAILPAADLFVAGYSSTVRWAVLTRTPAIVADLGWWGYDLYDDFAGVVTVRDRAAYARTLAELIADPDRRAALAAAHADKAASMGSFDGCAGRRLIELLDGLF